MATRVEYLASECRALLDYAARSRLREAQAPNNHWRGRYRRQAQRHERKVEKLKTAILTELGIPS